MTALIYRADQWKMEQSSLKTGCLDQNGNDRPYVAAYFSDKTTGAMIIAISAHWPHGQDESAMAELKGVIAGMPSDPPGDPSPYVQVMMADTNTAKSNSDIAAGLGIGEPIQQADVYNTCCSNDGYSNPFDRIITSSGASSPKTIWPYGTPGTANQPPYVTDNSWEFHFPVGLEVTLNFV